MSAALFAIASSLAVVGRVLCAGLSRDVGVRLGVLFGLGAVLAALPAGMHRGPDGLRPVIITLIIVLASGMTWRLPARLRTWAMEVVEGVMLGLALLVGLATDQTRSMGLPVVQGAAVVWALVGTAGGLRGHGFDPRPTTSLFMAAAVVFPAALTLSPGLRQLSPGLEHVAIVASCLVVAAVLPETRPAPGDMLVQWLWGLLGAGVVVAALWLAGLPLDGRLRLPALVGALVIGAWRVGFLARAAETDRPSTSDPMHLERETLVVLERLADPHASRVQGLSDALEHVFPGARMELLRKPEVDGTESGALVDDALLAEACRSGVLRSSGSDRLPGRVKGALRRLGRDAIVLPVVYDATAFGVLVIRGLQPSDSILVQLRRFADLLGHRLETQRLYEVLQHKQRLADLGTFAAALAHDLRSPLATARLEAQLMERSASEPQRRAIANIIRALDRVLRDLSGTLDFTRPLSLELRRLNAASLIDEVVATYQAQARGQGVELTASHDRDEAEIRGDRARLLRVFENLVRNALEVAPTGSAVDVRTTVNGTGLTVTVEDRGPGIDPELAARIFEPFVTTKAEGMGLGLAIVHKIVEAHRGRISTQTPAQGGTCMQVRLPLAKRSTSLPP